MAAVAAVDLTVSKVEILMANRPQIHTAALNTVNNHTEAPNPHKGSNLATQGNDVELGPINGQSGPGAGGADPNAILNECRGIDQGIDTIEQSLRDIERLHAQARGDTGGQSSLGRAIDEKGTTTMGLYRNLAARVKKVKSLPESGSPKNAPQVGRVDRRLKAAINKYQTLDRDYRRQLQSDMARQYKIVRPDASEAEVREAVEDTSNQQIFSQALMQSDRRGNAQGTYARVNERHEEIQKIERQMIELAELFQDMEALVVQQEPLVERIEEQGTVVNEDVGKANVEIAGAIEKARSRNRKKWWCLLIVLLIIIVVVVVAVVVTVINKQKKV
ncbi:MAG: hypothetical protein M1825_002763 [Sarcosagium campestre]|nr:MAG: hypothetical protein M1825_002763 [Sarcosagium campestre]